MNLLEQAIMYERARATREIEINDRLLSVIIRMCGPYRSDTAEDGTCSKEAVQPGVGDPVRPLESDLAIRHYQ